MPVTPAETAAYLRGRKAQVDGEVSRQAQLVRTRLPTAAALLREQFGATRVWLFGSHAVGRPHAESDVDLAVEGIGPCDIDRAHSAVESQLQTVVDLVQFESAPASLRHRIETEGQLL